ncbi:MAG: Kynureninase [Naasia sp.]|nr:Kynureninase [Naasia sp.]
MGAGYTPAAGIRRFLSGTPSVVAMQPMRDMLDLIERAGMAAVREKSMRLTGFALEAADALLADRGMTVATSRDPRRRGSHVTLEHPDARSITARVGARRAARLPGARWHPARPLSAQHRARRKSPTASRCSATAPATDSGD